jgi:DNA polymerase III alpha subunit (gram-positive type)
MIYCSIDIETTGFDFQNNDIVEFGAVIDDLNNPLPLEKLPKFHAIFLKQSYSGNPYALSMHSELFKKIDNANKKGLAECLTTGAKFMDLQELPASLESFLVKNGHKREKNGKIYVNVAGKNVACFDLPFLKTKIQNWGAIYFLNRTIDPAILYFDMQSDDKLPDMQKCLQRAGLDEEVPHTALEDSFIVVKLLRYKLCK